MAIYTLTGSVKDAQQNVTTAIVTINVQLSVTMPEMIGDLTVL